MGTLNAIIPARKLAAASLFAKQILELYPIKSETIAIGN